jgi:RNA polymerase sigma-70 factor (ECF subfamily)
LNDRLVTGLRERRRESLEELLNRHGPEIKAVAYLILRNASDAEEVTADTLLTAWHKISSLREPDRLRPWLFRIATRIALRRRSRRLVQTLPLDEARDIPGRAPSVIDPIELAQALDRLPPGMRAVIALHHVAGLTVAETAEAMGRSTNTVKSQLREALIRLRGDLLDDSASRSSLQEEPS